jgi:hypothetical protein
MSSVWISCVDEIPRDSTAWGVSVGCQMMACQASNQSVWKYLSEMTSFAAVGMSIFVCSSRGRAANDVSTRSCLIYHPPKNANIPTTKVLGVLAHSTYQFRSRVCWFPVFCITSSIIVSADRTLVLVYSI